MTRAWIGLGSNLDNPRDHVIEAFHELAETEGISMVARSSLYLSEPLGPQDQPDFINAAAVLETGLAADLLLYDDEQIRHPELTVPHPAIAERSFVLLPLQEIAPGLVIPRLGSVESLLQKLGNPVLEMTNDV